MRTKLFLESTQNQRCFDVEFYRRINVDKSTCNQRGYHVDRRRDVISTYINVESTLSVCWDSALDIMDCLKCSREIMTYSRKELLQLILSANRLSLSLYMSETKEVS